VIRGGWTTASGLAILAAGSVFLPAGSIHLPAGSIHLPAGCAILSAAELAAPALVGISPDDWPWWRGPTHDGHAAAGHKVPLSWSDEENVLWSADVPGRGSSSPTVVGDRVYLTTCDEGPGSQSVLAFDRRSGREAWRKEVHARGAMRKNERSTGASGSVACDGRRLFVAFATGDAVVVTALSLDGAQEWQARLCDYQIHQGYGGSPLVHGGTVIVVADHKGGGAVAALDRASGDTVWRKERPPTPNYSSPVVLHLHGRKQLVLTGCDKVVSHDPATGQTLWERPGATTECVTTPVTDGTRVFTSGGYPRNHVSAVHGDGSAVDWNNGDRVYVPSLLLRDGHLYAVLDAGVAVCWDAATGAEKWKHRLGGNFSASLVLLGDTIFATAENGVTHVFRARPDAFEAIGSNRLGDEAFATPAICGGRIYMRVAVGRGAERREKLVCIGHAAAAQP
jgi:outer membrane protein assembly factor BamB